MDGYSCQLISCNFFSDYKFFNANYGLEVKLSLEKIIDFICNDPQEQPILFLITDLNLTIDEAKSIDTQINQLNQNGHNITLQLLDHHVTGAKVSKQYGWYHLDTTKSATLITYEYFKHNYSNFRDHFDDRFDKYIQAVNAVDIWLEDDPLFEFGKVCMTLISKSHEINSILFPDISRNYRFALLRDSMGFLEQKDCHIALDEALYHLKKKHLCLDATNDTIDNLVSKYLVHTLENLKESMTVHYKEYKGLLTYSLGSISISANGFLKANPDYHFFVDISKRGKASFRANNKIDVANLAQKLAGGGGHPNASGAAFKDFEETIIYDDVKKYFQNKLDKLNC